MKKIEHKFKCGTTIGATQQFFTPFPSPIIEFTLEAGNEKCSVAYTKEGRGLFYVTLPVHMDNLGLLIEYLQQVKSHIEKTV